MMARTPGAQDMENGLRLPGGPIYNSCMKIEHRKTTSCPDYTENLANGEKVAAKMMLASALGIAAGLSLTACNDTVVGGDEVAKTYESSSSNDEDAVAGGVTYEGESSSSSEVMATPGSSAYHYSSSSQADTVQIIESGVVAVYESSSSWNLSSSSQKADIEIPVIEPAPLSGDIMYHHEDLSSIAEVSSSSAPSSSSAIPIEPVVVEPRLSGSIVYDMESQGGSSSSTDNNP